MTAASAPMSCVYGGSTPRATRTAFSAFSAACWAWKQHAQASMSGPFSRTTVASARSVLAFDSQRRAIARLRSVVDIDRPSLAECRVDDGPDKIRQSLDILRRRHDDVLPKWDPGRARCGSLVVSGG